MFIWSSLFNLLIITAMLLNKRKEIKDCFLLLLCLFVTNYNEEALSDARDYISPLLSCIEIKIKRLMHSARFDELLQLFPAVRLNPAFSTVTFFSVAAFPRFNAIGIQCKTRLRRFWNRLCYSMSHQTINEARCLSGFR